MRGMKVESILLLCRLALAYWID